MREKNAGTPGAQPESASYGKASVPVSVRYRRETQDWVAIVSGTGMRATAPGREEALGRLLSLYGGALGVDVTTVWNGTREVGRRRKVERQEPLPLSESFKRHMTANPDFYKAYAEACDGLLATGRKGWSPSVPWARAAEQYRAGGGVVSNSYSPHAARWIMQRPKYAGLLRVGRLRRG